MSIAVIGGTGFIGAAVAARVLSKGEPVLSVSRGRREAALPEGIQVATADRRDTEKLQSIFAEHDVGTVIDVLPLSLPETEPLLDAVRAAGARYVMVSSADVYASYGGMQRRESPAVTVPLTEEAPLRITRYPYRESEARAAEDRHRHFDDYDKIPVEEAVRSDERLRGTILRLPMVYGPGDRQHRFGWMVEAAQKGGYLALDGRVAGWRATHGFVTDVAEGIALAAVLERAEGRTYNLGEAEARSTAEWLEFVAHMMKRDLTVSAVPPEEKGAMWELAEASDLSYALELDTGRIRSELGFAEVDSAEEAMLRTIAWETSSLEARPVVGS